MSLIHTAALLGSLAASVSAHGYVQGIVAGGKWYSGYSPSFQYQNPPPVVIGWSDPEDLDNGFVDPTGYADPDIICHKDATPAGTSAKVAAGSTVELQWTEWPESHHGPVMDYLAKCSGSCSDVDKTTLKFFKIDHGGLIDDSTPPGSWASDQLIANNNSWSVTIPDNIAPGNYVLRHEIIALHSANNENGAQNYPQCINLEISGSGTEQPTGTLGTELYHADDPGIFVNIYTSLSGYKIPGPTVIAGAGSAPTGSVSAPGGPAAPSGSQSVSYSYNPLPSSAAASGSASGSSPPSPSSSAAAVGTSSAYLSVYPSPTAGAPAPSSSAAAVGSSSSYLSVYPSPTGGAPAPSSSAAAVGSSSAFLSVYPSPSNAAPGSSSASYSSYFASSAAAASGSSSYSVYPSGSASAGPGSSGLTTTCTKTITVSGKSSAPASSAAAVSGSSYAAVSSGAVPSSPAYYASPSSGGPASSASAPYECLSNIYSAIPTGYLSRTFSAMPTGSAYPSAGIGGVNLPPQPLPDGFTFGDVLLWFKFMVKQVFSKKVHARDFNARQG